MTYSTITEIIVPFHDVDSMNVAWHGHYAKYFEVARCEFLDSIGYNYVDMKNSGYAWPVIDMRIKYVKPLTFGQRIKVQCTLAEWEYRLKINYLISDAVTGERLTKGYTCQVAVSMQDLTMCFESPKALIDRLQPLIDQTSL